MVNKSFIVGDAAIMAFISNISTSKSGARYFSFIKSILNVNKSDNSYFNSLCQSFQVKSSLKLAGIPAMLRKRSRELMGAIHRGAGAEIKVSMPVWIKHGVQAGFVRDADRSRRQSLMKIGVVWRVNLQMLVKNPVKGIPITKGDGRVSLKPHSLMQAIEINPCYRGIFRLVIGL